MCIECQVNRAPQSQLELFRMAAAANQPCDIAEMRDFHLTAFAQEFASPIHAAKAAPILSPTKPSTLVTTTASTVMVATTASTGNDDCLDWDVRDPQLALSLQDFTCDIDFFSPADPPKPLAIPASLPMLAEDGVDEWDVRDPQLAASLAGFEFSF